MNEYKAGLLVRILKLADDNPHGYGHRVGDIGLIREVKDFTALVEVAGRKSTSDYAPCVRYSNLTERLQIL